MGIVRVRQNEKTRVIEHQRQAAATLLRRPADELIAVAQMRRRRAETDHGEPLASVSGRVTQVLAGLSRLAIVSAAAHSHRIVVEFTPQQDEP